MSESSRQKAGLIGTGWQPSKLYCGGKNAGQNAAQAGRITLQGIPKLSAQGNSSAIARANGAKRRTGGHTLIELSMLSVLFVVMAVLCLDIGYVLMASEINDSACRDAARAAAEADNYATSLQLAQAAVVAHAADGVYVTSPVVNTAQFTYQDFAGSPPANTSPYVSVTTTCNVKVPAPILFMGTSFMSSGSMQFSKTYVFPIVKTQLYLP